MSNKYEITVSDEVDAALKSKAAKDGITATELINKQVVYYLGCALYDSLDPNHPLQTPGLSIQDRLEVYAVGVNKGMEAARNKVTALRAERG